MPTLLETQQIMRSSLLGHDNQAVADFLSAESCSESINIYRNTVLISLTKALKLSYPVVLQLVGEEFFEATALEFARKEPPQLAYLDRYGGGFSTFLRAFLPAAGVPYLADVARLEWAINRAIHAPDLDAIDVHALEAISPADQERVRFRWHPSISLLDLAYPADVIWRAIVDGNDSALAEIDIDAGPVWLLIERGKIGVRVERMQRPAWMLARQLFSRTAIASVIGASDSLDVAFEIAGHLAAGRIVSFHLSHKSDITD
jgi:hypothetical protein